VKEELEDGCCGEKKKRKEKEGRGGRMEKMF
jgi:hypothetical protein